MKQSTTEPAGPTDRGRELESRNARQQAHADATDVPLPHETDQRPESQHEEGTREVGEQAHRDVERGLVDTDRRGADEYQKRTQRDEHANVNSEGEGKP